MGLCRPSFCPLRCSSRLALRRYEKKQHYQFFFNLIKVVLYSCSNEDNAAFADGLFVIPDSYVSLPFNMALLGVHKLVEPSDRKHNRHRGRSAATPCKNA